MFSYIRTYVYFYLPFAIRKIALALKYRVNIYESFLLLPLDFEFFRDQCCQEAPRQSQVPAKNGGNETERNFLIPFVTQFEREGQNFRKQKHSRNTPPALQKMTFPRILSVLSKLNTKLHCRNQLRLVPMINQRGHKQIFLSPVRHSFAALVTNPVSFFLHLATASPRHWFNHHLFTATCAY